MSYTLHHPRWHRRPMPLMWWLRGCGYLKFIARELSSVFVAYSCLLLVAHFWALGRGEESYARFASWLERPGIIALHALVLGALLFHTVTWLNLTPKALALRLGGRRVSPAAIRAAHYVAWLVVTVIVLWLLGGA
jgi:fumarate reductase subunit C